MQFGTRVRELREHCGLPQKELAERLECLFETVYPIPCITGSGMTVFEAAQMSFGAVGSKVVAQAIRFSLTKQSKS